MSYDVFSIRDVKVGFGQLTLDNGSGAAIRNFSFFCSSGIPNFAIDDFALYKIGSFDLVSGVFSPLPVPEFVISGYDAFRLYHKE